MRLALLCLLLCGAHAHAAFPRERLARLLGLGHRLDEPSTTPVRPSTSSCMVVGTLHSRVDAFSVAVVRCADRSRNVWIGDALDDGVVVGIGHAELLLRRGGQLERIATGTPTGRPPPVASPQAVTTPRARLVEAMRDPTTILQEVRMMPAFVDGRWSGLRATWVKEGSWLATLGLQRGDVVRAVNGQPLDGLESALGALQKLPQRQEVEIELERNGERTVRRVRLE